jgi:hypothetical protein
MTRKIKMYWENLRIFQKEAVSQQHYDPRGVDCYLWSGLQCLVEMCLEPKVVGKPLSINSRDRMDESVHTNNTNH